MMDQKRFEHCIGVSETSRKLARLNNYDEDKAALAGFIHDYAKQIPNEEFIKVIKKENFDPDLLNYNRAIWHGIVGTYFDEVKDYDMQVFLAFQRVIHRKNLMEHAEEVFQRTSSERQIETLSLFEQELQLLAE